MSRTDHCKNHRHHRQFAILHGLVVVYVCRPCSIQRDKTPCVDGATKDVLGYEIPLIPRNNLLILRMGVFPLSNFAKPFVVWVVS